MTDSERRIRRGTHTAREAALSAPGVADVKLRRFHAAMDALEPGEGEEVYRRLSGETWYAKARKILAPSARASSSVKSSRSPEAVLA